MPQQTPLPLELLAGGQTQFTGGVLAQAVAKNLQNLFLKIDLDALKRVFAEEHEPGYAEPEFVGKYLDTAMAVYESTRDEKVLASARDIVATMIQAQRADGYLGTYKQGHEFESFGIWNHQFAIFGLLPYCRVTGDKAALACATRCGEFVAKSFMAKDGPDLLHCGNMGIQHSCILPQMAQLYALTHSEECLSFCHQVLARWETSNLRLLTDAGRYFSIGCLKAAEMLLCYQGLLELLRATGQQEYLDPARQYWDCIRRTQIGLTGNGSIAETWSMVGNRPAHLSNDIHPYENCVAVCWMKLSGMLLEHTGQALYADALEQTLYNHLLGSQALDGHDFSYYQGNIGRKLHFTSQGMYACCRYRGMNMLARLNRYVVMSAQDGLAVNLYADSRTTTNSAGTPVELVQRTDYPRTGTVKISIKPAKNTQFALYLRKPAFSRQVSVSVAGVALDAITENNGYIRIERVWPESGTTIELHIDMTLKLLRGVVEERESAAVSYGPLLLAIDTRYGTPLESTDIAATDELTRLPVEKELPMAAFQTRGRINGQPKPVTLVDYASAGSLDNTRDRFKVWIPVAP